MAVERDRVAMDATLYSDEQKQYRAVYAQFLQRVTVGIVPGGDPATAFGTGVVLSTPKGVPFIITARHVVADGWSPLNVALPVQLSDVAAGIMFASNPLGRGAKGDDHVDVAVVTIRPEAREQMNAMAAPTSVIPTEMMAGTAMMASSC